MTPFAEETPRERFRALDLTQDFQMQTNSISYQTIKTQVMHFRDYSKNSKKTRNEGIEHTMGPLSAKYETAKNTK
jgi:hypothetical protein